jgi:hypothetical protein
MADSIEHIKKTAKIYVAIGLILFIFTGVTVAVAMVFVVPAPSVIATAPFTIPPFPATPATLAAPTVACVAAAPAVTTMAEGAAEEITPVAVTPPADVAEPVVNDELNLPV